jgi:hypothetical protein
MRLYVVLFLSFLLIGCSAQNENADIMKKIDSVKNNLGDFQYLGLDPKLSISISKAYFNDSDKPYGNPEVTFTANIKQYNDEFPLTVYDVNVRFMVLDENDNEVAEFTAFGRMENGVLSIADVKELYGAIKKSAEGLRLEAKHYTWYPINKHQVYMP